MKISVDFRKFPTKKLNALWTRGKCCDAFIMCSFRSGGGDQRLLLKSVIGDIPRLVGTDSWSAWEPSLSLILVLAYMPVLHEYACVTGRPWYNKMAATQFKNFLYAFCGKRKTRPVYTERPSKPGSFSFQAKRIFLFLFIFLWEWERITLMALGDFTFKT